MNCSCNDVLISWVRGNSVNLTLYLKCNDEEFFVDGYDSWSVGLLRNGVVNTAIETALDDDNRIVVSCPSTLQAGDYSLVVTMQKEDAGRRSAQCGIIRIVEDDADANVTYDVVTGTATANVNVSFQLTESVWAQPLNDYELWKQIEGNEDKTLQDFIDEIIVQSDWEQTDTTASDYILNKPYIYILNGNYDGSTYTFDFTADELLYGGYYGATLLNIGTSGGYHYGYVLVECIIGGRYTFMNVEGNVWRKLVIDSDLTYTYTEGAFQEELVSGTSIKTINNQSLLGSGNITIQGGDGGGGTIDNALSTTSENAVQNKVITNALNTKQDTISDLATIRSGAALGATALQSQAQADWNEADNTAADYIKNKPTLFSGDYKDLTNKPTIPAAQVQADWGQVDNTAIDYIKNKPANIVTSVNTQTGDVVLSIPSKTSDLQNDSGFITDAGVTSFNGSTGAVLYSAPVSSVNGQTGAVSLSIPSKTSDLTNDSNFITSSAITNMQITDNLVTSISSSSTNNTYPSALCVYNALATKQDAITHVVTGSAQSYTIWSGTQAQFGALGSYDSNTLYLITET